MKNLSIALLTVLCLMVCSCGQYGALTLAPEKPPTQSEPGE